MADHVGQFVDAGDVFQGTKLYDKGGSFVSDQGAAAGSIPPTISDISPSPAQLSEDTPFALTVSGASTRTIIAIRYAGLRFTEIVHDGDAFTDRYQSSARVDLGGGAFRYTILRSPVWPDAPEVKVYAFAGGAEL